jgi:hypothetical protein
VRGLSVLPRARAAAARLSPRGLAVLLLAVAALKLGRRLHASSSPIGTAPTVPKKSIGGRTKGVP